MKLIKRYAPLVGAAILLGLATVFALLATDVHAWQHRLATDDLRFRAHPSFTSLWKSPASLPGDPAQELLGLGDALSYREGVQSFWLNEIGVAHAKGSDLSVLRIANQVKLQRLSTGAATAAERSVAANLLGVMTITTTAGSKAALAQILQNATADFRLAIKENPASWAAKVNLELALRLKRPGKSHFGADAHGGFGSGGFSGISSIGGGF